MTPTTTPTSYHTSVLPVEALDALSIRPGGTYVDATFGGGGHSRLILERLGAQGRLIAFDQDEDAWKNAPDDPRFTLITENFRWLSRFLRLHGTPQVDGILADLGVSSHQFDTGERGFSTRYDGPLDMRMDQRSERTAADILKTYPEEALHRLFEQYGEVRNSRQLARHIAQGRKGARLTTISSFKAFIAPVVKGVEARYLAQVFQALRIEVNEELEALKVLLRQSADCLKPGGRLAVISFHSLEDRLVKRFMKNGRFEEELPNNDFAVPEQAAPFSLITPKPLEPSPEEQGANPRSRSARLRVAERRPTGKAA